MNFLYNMIMKNNLKPLRKRKRLTQEELASLIHVSTDTYRNYETGRSDPPLETLIKLSKILECSTDEILLIESFEIKQIQADLFKLLKELQILIQKILK